MAEAVTMWRMLLYCKPLFTERLFVLTFPADFMGLCFQTAHAQNREFSSHVAWRGRTFLLREGNTANDNSGRTIVSIFQRLVFMASNFYTSEIFGFGKMPKS
jgi:hypothetical protein